MGIYNPRDIDAAVTVEAVEPRPDIDDTVLSDKGALLSLNLTCDLYL